MASSFGGEPRLVMAAGGMRWIAAFLTGLFAIDAMLVVGLLVTNTLPLISIMAGTIAIALIGVLLWLVLPRRYEVYDDRLAIVFGGWRWNVELSSIDVVREAAIWKSYGYWGVRFAMAPGQAIEIRRLNAGPTRPNIVISPADRATFLAELNSAMARNRRLNGAPSR